MRSPPQPIVSSLLQPDPRAPVLAEHVLDRRIDVQEYDYWPPAPVNEEEPMSRLKRPPETPLYVGE